MSVLNLLALPRLLKSFLARLTRCLPNWCRRLLGGCDHITADFYDIMRSRSVGEERKITCARDEYRATWHEKWITAGLDFVLTVPHAFPALAHNTSEKTTLMSAGYTFIFSLVSVYELSTSLRTKRSFTSLARLHSRNSARYLR
jgi:hypothetical protein